MNSSAEFALRCRAALFEKWPVLMTGMNDVEQILPIIAKAYVEFESACAQANRNRVNGIPPTVDEVRAYTAEIGYGLDPEYFVDFYQARGWKVGRNQSMKDWKSTMRNWKRNNWGPSHTAQAGSVSVMPKISASLGAIQMQLEAVKREIRGIINPGGAAWNKTASQLTPSETERIGQLQMQRDRLQKLIENYGA